MLRPVSTCGMQRCGRLLAAGQILILRAELQAQGQLCLPGTGPLALHLGSLRALPPLASILCAGALYFLLSTWLAFTGDLCPYCASRLPLGSTFGCAAVCDGP